MEIIIRDYRPEDAGQVIEVYRDSVQSMRESAGGLHPDSSVERLLSRRDEAILASHTEGGVLLVAELDSTGRLAGMGAVATPLSSLIGSAYSRSFYVRREFQRGKGGLPVGSMLREAAIARAKKMGFRKIYGYSTPEAIPFHKKFGAVFYPEHDLPYLDSSATLHYYEIELKKSPLNGIRVEPLLFRLSAKLEPLIKGDRYG
ncbi:MAG: GNAT family N-acetyltransferase [Candidatus Micrarchaeota archaeon]